MKKKRGWNLKNGNPDGDRGRRLGGLAHDREHLRRAGRIGWDALVAKKGLEGAHDRLREWRLANPTDLERRAMDALDLLGASYEREVVLSDGERFGTVDFLVGGTALEVDGDAAHGVLTPGAAGYERTKAEICALEGLRLYRLPERTVRNGRLALVIEELLKGEAK